jgi:predicted dehydrogenase
MSISLIGCGPMGLSYYQLLDAMKVPFTVHGRGKESADWFEGKTGHRPMTGDLKSQLASLGKVPDYAIVAVSVDTLAPVTAELLEAGVKRILVEKPAGLTPEEVAGIAQLDKDHRVFVAYNRRFYPSTTLAAELIKQDGGPTSLFFEFTEIVDRVMAVYHRPPIKENWFFANSTHVVDMAFFLGGVPGAPDAIDLKQAITAGSLPWHSRATRFAGAGVIGKDCLFSYLSDWETGGRWRVEVSTPKRRFILAPLEKVFIQDRGRFDLVEQTLPAEPVDGMKPGLSAMVSGFLADKPDPRLPTLSEQSARMKLYADMLEPKNKVS